jgi:YD repeat-containing protein
MNSSPRRFLIGSITISACLIRQLLPYSREILYNYDANGNLTSITPPGKPAHNFSHTPVDLTDDYTPP